MGGMVIFLRIVFGLKTEYDYQYSVGVKLW